MQILSQTPDLRMTLQDARRSGQRIAFVPTMGNLHEGHLQLVQHARELADIVVVSIFVNPLQFNDAEDFRAYPATLARDQQQLQAAGVDCLYTPTVDAIYPYGMVQSVRVEVPGLSDLLCGAFRPGHFVGVTTVVTKLFNLVRPDVAVFGEKDYQQLLLIQRLVTDLALAIDIVGVDTVREPDGLAMSSRNAYLKDAERQQAAALYHVLSELQQQYRQGCRDFAKLEQAAMSGLSEAGFRPEYVAIRRNEDLAEADHDDELRVLAAAWLGSARLIDNLRL